MRSIDMRLRSLLACAAIAFAVPAAAAPSEQPVAPPTKPDEGPPLDAPPACTAPVGDQPSTMIQRGPRHVGTARIAVGRARTVGGLRISVGAHFIPSRVGASTGETLTGVTVVDVDAARRDGPTSRNTVDHNDLGGLRIGTYRVTTRMVTARAKRPTGEARVEDLGCLEEYVHPPLDRAGEQLTVWLSTEATQTYALSRGHWHQWREPRFYVAVTADLDPDVQQTPGTTTPHGWIALEAFENHGGVGERIRLTNDQIVAGARLSLPLHVVEVLDVTLGPDTTRVDGRIVTAGRAPVIAARVRVTRR